MFGASWQVEKSHPQFHQIVHIRDFKFQIKVHQKTSDNALLQAWQPELIPDAEKDAKHCVTSMAVMVLSVPR